MRGGNDSHRLLSVLNLRQCHIEFHGKLIKKGDMVIAVVKAANHDESQFADPDELDITRTINRNLAFGYGIHTCWVCAKAGW